ncbi:flavin reductase family protein [uncultured Friedmanniella sp.]|uniref:flavin reductase family protein n=1 Tax=uncultured Friedmanniella sp. TaxID=335381 RepID=UPI0035C95E08
MTTDPDPRTAAPATPEDGPSRVSPELFKSVFRRHPAGVAVITFADGDLRYGFTATSVISVSADPPILTFSIDSGSSSWPALAEADTLVINFLAATQAEVSARFATRGIDRFADGGWSRLPTGEPVLDGSLSWVRGRVLQRTAIGRSFLVSVLALEATEGDDAAPLVYHDRTYHAVNERTAI